MDFITTKDGTKLFYRDQGEGAPVVLIHGWPANADMFEYQVPALLDAGYRVISYDRRGFGRSGHSAKGYDYDTFAADLNDLLEELDLNAVNLVGFSMGGGEIARYLGTYGAGRVATSTLISSVVPYLLKTENNPEGVDEAAFDQMIEQIKEDRPHFLTGFAKQFYGVGLVSKPVSPEILNWTAYLAYPASPVATAECVNAFGKTDFRPDLKAFTMPTLVIHGTADKTVPIGAAGDAAAKGIATATYKRYEGAPHGLFVTHKEELNGDLVAFLGQHARKDFVGRKPRPSAESSRSIN